MDEIKPQIKEGQDQKGRFVKGNRIALGHGNPNQKKIFALRAAELKAVTTKDIKDVYHKLLELCLQGNVLAIKILLERTAGRLPPDTHISVSQSDNGTKRIEISLDDQTTT
jgi:hypothetical protein